ncbi:hypothetical protein [Nocardioides pocheonensis]|uniref:LPXTG cell wall anchor domain-containing protein n=1 Tax=Nocardioides pocheonensis TaxID=661485 RepID=A0A3N0GNI9_9ACTN|nr:hypothetical protein [Nocardioides pocheonensis]RNM13712.1 hypothetical protein EFL26_12060 [Nocardioides pocheonensis]
MTTQTRFLTGSLASLAIASAVTLAAPSAYAADAPARPCGQPAVPAVYVTVTSDPEVRIIPAITHDEWRWERQVPVLAHEYVKVLHAAYTETDWSRDVAGTTEYRWTRTVIDRAAVPAVPGTPEVGHWETVVVTPAVTRTLVEYQQQQTGALRWEPEGWNGEKGDDDKGQGWVRTGRTTEEVVTPAVTDQHWVVDQAATDGTPAVTELSHVEYTWAAASPGTGWTATGDSHTVGGGTETTTTTDDAQPSGAGWTVVATRSFPAVVDTQWALEAPDGYTDTGNVQVDHLTTEETDGTAATPPAGDGWSQVPDSLVVVVDQPATTELVGSGSTEEVLVSPALDATPPCPQAAPADGGSSSADAPQIQVAAAVSGAHSGTAHHAAHASTSASAASATVLPETGNPVSPWLLTTGLGALLTGGVLVRAGRRRHAR